MAQTKLTKTELRMQQTKLTQLQKYLPTLQLKKSLLQSEVNDARAEIVRIENAFHEMRLSVSSFSGLLSDHFGVSIEEIARIEKIEKHYDNIAGIEIPLLDGVLFAKVDYPLFTTPPWFDEAVKKLHKMSEAKAKVRIAEEKLKALEQELREVTIRVNLFEKNLIPKTMDNIRKIKVFLGDQELAAVSQSKVAKTKIEEREHKKMVLR